MFLRMVFFSILFRKDVFFKYLIFVLSLILVESLESVFFFFRLVVRFMILIVSICFVLEVIWVG